MTARSYARRVLSRQDREEQECSRAKTVRSSRTLRHDRDKFKCLYKSGEWLLWGLRLYVDGGRQGPMLSIGWMPWIEDKWIVYLFKKLSRNQVEGFGIAAYELVASVSICTSKIVVRMLQTSSSHAKEVNWLVELFCSSLDDWIKC